MAFRDKWKIERMAAGHCTGQFAFAELIRVFGPRFDWKAGRLWPTMASSIEPAEIEAETFLARQSDLDSSAPAARRSPAAYRAKAEPKKERGSSKSENRSDEIDERERRRAGGRADCPRRATDSRRS